MQCTQIDKATAWADNGERSFGLSPEEEQSCSIPPVILIKCLEKRGSHSAHIDHMIEGMEHDNGLHVVMQGHETGNILNGRVVVDIVWTWQEVRAKVGKSGMASHITHGVR